MNELTEHLKQELLTKGISALRGKGLRMLVEKGPTRSAVLVTVFVVDDKGEPLAIWAKKEEIKLGEVITVADMDQGFNIELR